jgi:hypothetical protein
MTRENFNSIKHLNNVYRKVYNPLVNEYFNDVDADDAIEISTPRASLKAACKIQETDTLPLLQARLWLFYVVLGNLKGSSLPLINNYSHSSRRRNKPKVTLYFQEDLQDVADDYDPVAGEIGFRLMDAGGDDDITESAAKALGQQIKSLFGGSGFIWRKGKDLVSYSDWEKGYQLQILCRDKDEGKRVIERVLSIQNHNPNWENMNYIANEQPSARYPTIPLRKPVLGRMQRMQRERPIADVRFQYASVTIRGMKSPKLLYARNNYFSDRALVS